MNLTRPSLVPDGGTSEVVEDADPAADGASLDGVDTGDDAPADVATDDAADTGVDRPPDVAIDVPPEVPPSTLTTGLVGWWKLDVLSGLTTPDSSGLGNTGSILGGPTVVTSGFAPVTGNQGAFRFIMQTDAAVVAPVAASLRPTAITVATWVRFASLGTNRGSCGGIDSRVQYLLHHRNNRGVGNGLLEGVALLKQADNSFAFILTSRSGARDILPSTTHVTGTNTWVHVAGTFDGATMSVYVNGNRENMFSYPNALDYDPTRSWYLARTGECGGTGEDTYDGKLNGDLDDVRIYNRALTSGEIFLLASGSN